VRLGVLILAGGLGTRLRPVVQEVPKSLAPIKGLPFLIYLLEWIYQQKIVAEVILSVGYKADLIAARLGYSYKNIMIKYIQEETPLGTGGAIKYALHGFGDCENYLVLNGDTYAAFELSSFLKFHEQNHSDISIASCEMTNFSRYGSLSIDHRNSITKFNKKMFVEKGYINCGAYLFTSGFYTNFIKKYSSDKFSFEKDILETSNGSFGLKAYRSNFFFIDIGVPEDYERAQVEFPELIVKNE
jgi:D-glycero-alpha-D-manno-heptose 1-phosphate guanylyltransferase